MTAAPGFTGWVSDLARRHTHHLAAIARGEGLHADDALDAVQDGFHTFLLLPQARVLADQDDDAAALLAVIVRNAARNARRRHFRARPHGDVDDTPLTADDPSVDQLLASAEDHVKLIGCINRLGEVQRQVVTLRMLEEVAAPEVAATLGLTAGHVAVLLHRAKASLRTCMS